MRFLIRFALLLALIGSLPAQAAQGPAKASAASKPGAKRADAGEVTAKNLLESERYWPYHVVTVQPWKPMDAEKPLAKGTRGVLIRVEPSGLARIDFGRNGIYEVPVSATDLIAAANQVRRGKTEKDFPNFVLAIGPRLVDTPTMQTIDPDKTAQHRVFLCAFADPAAEGFGELLKSLDSLPASPEAMSLLFPQREQAVPELGKQL